MVSLSRCGNCGHFIIKDKNDEWKHWMINPGMKELNSVECTTKDCTCDKPTLWRIWYNTIL